MTDRSGYQNISIIIKPHNDCYDFTFNIESDTALLAAAFGGVLIGVILTLVVAVVIAILVTKLK